MLLPLLNALERLARRVWRERWNAIAHAEFRRSFWRSLTLQITLPLLCIVVVAAMWRSEGFATASATARIALGVFWLAIAGMSIGPTASMFDDDCRLQVTEAWLLTSEPREETLSSRLAGLSLSGPLLLVVVAPFYFVAALGMPPGAAPLFVCGHAARIGTAFESLPLDTAAVLAAVPVAVMAMLADIIVPPAYAAMVMPNGLYRAASRRHGPLPFIGIFYHGRLFMASLSLSLLALLTEGALATGAAFWFWGTAAWKLSYGVEAGLSLPLSVLCAGLLIGLRWLLARAGIDLAARHYDHTLITDEPC
jgi:hypothetical protein